MIVYNSQQCNNAPAAPALPEGVIRGHKNFVKIWDRFLVLQDKSRVWLNYFTINLDFSVKFFQIAPSMPLYQGRHLGAPFYPRGAPYWLDQQRYATDNSSHLFKGILRFQAFLYLLNTANPRLIFLEMSFLLQSMEPSVLLFLL